MIKDRLLRIVSDEKSIVQVAEKSSHLSEFFLYVFRNRALQTHLSLLLVTMRIVRSAMGGNFCNQHQIYCVNAHVRMFENLPATSRNQPNIQISGIRQKFRASKLSPDLGLNKFEVLKLASEMDDTLQAADQYLFSVSPATSLLNMNFTLLQECRLRFRCSKFSGADVIPPPPTLNKV